MLILSITNYQLPTTNYQLPTKNGNHKHYYSIILVCLKTPLAFAVLFIERSSASCGRSQKLFVSRQTEKILDLVDTMQSKQICIGV